MLKSQESELKSQEAEQPSRTPSGAPRVTPDELNAALAAIEIRRQAEAKTIPLDQAVSELHLDSTPDEIWAEVQAQREKTALPKAAPMKPPQQAVQPLSVSMPVVRVRSRGWRRLLAPVLVLGVLMSTGVIPHSFTPLGFSPSLLTQKTFSNDAPILRPFSQIPKNTEVYADDNALRQISEGKPAAQILVSENPSGSRWTLVKIKGHVYLHGFTASADSLTALAGKALPVYNDNNSGDLHGVSTSDITLRVDAVPLQKSGGDSDYSSITVPNFQPDSFTTLTPGN